MPQPSLSAGGPGKLDDKGWPGTRVRAISAVLRIAFSRLMKPLAIAGGKMEARKFRREVIREMSLTVTNLHPDVSIGGTDQKGWYTEIYLDFGEFRLRITRGIYNSGRRDLWADIGSTSDPVAFFRMDYVITALKRLDPACEIPYPLRLDTLAALDAIIWALRGRLARQLSPDNYAATERTIRQVMHEEAALAHPES